MSKKRAIKEGYARGGECSNNTTVKPDITPAAQPNTRIESLQQENKDLENKAKLLVRILESIERK